MDKALDFLVPFIGPAKIALVVVSSVWAFIEYACFWMTDKWRRLTAALVGQTLLFVVHWTGLYDFGPGPAGWALVMVIGMFASPLAALVHDQVINRFCPQIKAPWSKANAPRPAPAEPEQP